MLARIQSQLNCAGSMLAVDVHLPSACAIYLQHADLLLMPDLYRCGLLGSTGIKHFVRLKQRDWASSHHYFLGAWLQTLALGARLAASSVGMDRKRVLRFMRSQHAFALAEARTTCRSAAHHPACSVIPKPLTLSAQLALPFDCGVQSSQPPGPNFGVFRNSSTGYRAGTNLSHITSSASSAWLQIALAAVATFFASKVSRPHTASGLDRRLVVTQLELGHSNKFQWCRRLKSESVPRRLQCLDLPGPALPAKVPVQSSRLRHSSAAMLGLKAHKHLQLQAAPTRTAVPCALGQPIGYPSATPPRQCLNRQVPSPAVSSASTAKLSSTHWLFGTSACSRV